MVDTPLRPDPDSADDSNTPTPPSQKKKEDITLRRWTMAGLAFAVVIGLVVCASHGGTVTVSIAGLGASLGLGGVLGFLFGIPNPGSAKPSVNINQVNAAGVVEGGQGGNANAGQAGDPNPNPNPQAQNQGAGAGNAQPQPPKPILPTPAPEPTSGHVSNLEQVADWVTKLLLGGGLTQMQRIPPKIWQWSHVVAVGILGRTDVHEQIIVAEQAFACGLMVYGFILGFFAGFLITKLQLGKAIAD